MKPPHWKAQTRAATRSRDGAAWLMPFKADLENPNDPGADL
jgi:hypothetical protein